LIEAKADEGAGAFEALASAFGNIDRQNERVRAGAFTETLREWRASGREIPVVVSHKWDDPFAVIGSANPDHVHETTRGLLVRGSLDLEDNATARQVHKLMRRGNLTAWSFGFTVPPGGSSRKDGVTEINRVDLHEVGPCLVGANADAQLVAVKSALDETPQEYRIDGKTWDGSASNYDDKQYAAACILDRSDCGEGLLPAKQRYSLPIARPGESWRVSPDAEGVHAAAQRLESVKACPKANRNAAQRLIRAYVLIGEDPPESVTAMAAKSLADEIGELSTDELRAKLGLGKAVEPIQIASFEC
jgi:HK97 family phage prohead protease